MDRQKRQKDAGKSAGRLFGAGLAVGIVATVVAGVIVWLVVAYTGIYNVAASEPHTDPVRWTLDTTMHRSVASRADDTIEVPENPSRNLLASGAGHYAATCVYCHGAPGQDPAQWTQGMRPEPPRLAEAASEWEAAEIYWIVENGIRMTGMPAFGEYHTREELVALAALVSALPGLTADDYARLTDGH